MTAIRAKLHCHYCGRQMKATFGAPHSKTVDHKTPLSRGGEDVASNRVMACWRCNNVKGSLTEAEFRARYGDMMAIPERWPVKPQPKPKPVVAQRVADTGWTKMDRVAAAIPFDGSAVAMLGDHVAISGPMFSVRLERRIQEAEWRLSFDRRSFAQWQKRRK